MLAGRARLKPKINLLHVSVYGCPIATNFYTIFFLLYPKKLPKTGCNEVAEKKNEIEMQSRFDLVWFYGISTIVGYLMPNPSLYI